MTIAPGAGQGDTGAILEAAETAAIDGAVAIKGRSPWQIVWSRLRRDKVSMVALVMSALMVLLAIVSPILATSRSSADLNHPTSSPASGRCPRASPAG